MHFAFGVVGLSPPGLSRAPPDGGIHCQLRGRAASGAASQGLLGWKRLGMSQMLRPTNSWSLPKVARKPLWGSMGGHFLLVQTHFMGSPGGDKLSILTATSSCHPPHYTAFFSVRRSSTEGAEPPVGDPHHLRPVVCCRADLGLGVDPRKRKTDRFVGEVGRKVPIVGVCGHEFLESWLLGPCFGERARCRVDGSACGTL